ncbi:MAG: riboflavin synthase [SAR86 cluster bacterium]|uniref:Riboflavin synthase n=1 Tax=SAR86 cluster bacterium TaxID=2030880 RepID=A0A2A5B6U1_9GAMM|nr:MAG: riboflavin synthase [SAR86 cluster bacterium]
MFTGIIEATGVISKLQQSQSDWRLHVNTEKLDLSDVVLGDSIAVNGCCLTVIELLAQGFCADVSNETMKCTTLSSLKAGARVNLEKAMLATSRFGGHIVSGHVDGVGSLLSRVPDGQSVKLVYNAPAELAKYIAAKGSICIDGTSLTVNGVLDSTFTVNIIPHTQEETIIANYVVGQQVNLEVDLVARYLERLMQGESTPANSTSIEKAPIDKEFLTKHGF